MSEYHEETLRRSPEAFRKRNIALERRNLIVLDDPQCSGFLLAASPARIFYCRLAFRFQP
jgi:hypothetical protein